MVELDFTTAQSPPREADPDVKFPCLLKVEQPFSDVAAHFSTFNLVVDVERGDRTDPQECESVAGSGPGMGLLCLNPGEEARTGLLMEWEGDVSSYRAGYDELVTEEEVFDWAIDVVRCTESEKDQPLDCTNWPNPNPRSWNATWIFTPHVPDPTPAEIHTFLRLNKTPLKKAKGKPVDSEFEFIGLCALDFQIRVSCIDETECPCFDSNGSVVSCVPE